ncbi:two-component sensor histidine kinase [Cystobacter fuscus]|uniref:Two-component sensor histidine kinase n=1 Tax=Cystobacter fuscus TaxID=43 RepID=A0A250J512_9BACT|nr:histidine kinase [Cystobacter fuscus]ATB38256.1 two-component sensor histidine kinase [Cystobacter fuscus]
MRLPTAFHPLLFVSALLTWSVVGVQGLVFMNLTSQHLTSASVLVWFVAFVSFGVAFWLKVRGEGRPGASLLGTQTVAALAVIATGTSGFEGALLAIISGQVPMFLSSRSTLLWCAGLVLASLAVYLFLYPPLDALASAGGYAGLLVFTATAAHIQQRELDGRRELARLHARLEAAQALLAEREREQERLRIARELHDSLGHHLTALSLNIEAASHSMEGPGLEHVRRAQKVARTLLREVREVVSSLREGPLQLGPALADLTREVPGLQVHLQVAEGLSITEPAAAHCLLRCVQEVITNTLRHASAHHLWIDVVSTGEGALRLHARDDGVGAVALEPGAGLTGMRERFTQLGGSLEWRLVARRGVELVAWLPTRGAQG